MAQAAFLRALRPCHPEKKLIAPGTLASFMKLNKPSAGCTNALRLEMEEIWESHYDPRTYQKGFTLTRKTNQRYWCRADSQPYEDKYGWMHFGRGWETTVV
ncbi:hypothetical protein QBC35DRAFT_450667 [Podospora australis]|uniref:Uncharacterized protein n=1 Tax=Podospora australis TaxID=1536484 RepID=A0AAN6WVK4_9PEZI|nr:hypothetical protein QBC35DRAFT_450667 [Podospora australis]